MKILKFLVLWMTMTIVMVIVWSVGSWIGNAITQTVPPSVSDPAAVGLAVMMVCVINSLLWSVLFWSTRYLAGSIKFMSLLLFLFATQFLLTQLETLFFSSSLSISVAQTMSILIAGLVMVSVTAGIGLLLLRRLAPGASSAYFRFDTIEWRSLVVPLLLLSVFGYPFLYQVFGYYVAWQNEHLRFFYAGSAELKPFFTQLPSYFSDGIYFFQVFRGIIWVAISIPVVMMLRRNAIVQYVLMALLCALPAVQLFIPNPYMPNDIAMSHFYETASSNFIWGLMIVFALRRLLGRQVSVQELGVS